MDQPGIDEFLEYNVDDNEWLYIVNGQWPIFDLLDLKSLQRYIEEENERYCEENGLCPVCRASLVEKYRMDEYWGSVQRVFDCYACPNGCV